MIDKKGVEFAMERAPYGRQREAPAAKNNSQPLAPQYRGETYYDLPALKPSHYGQLVASYLFIGGLAGIGNRYSFGSCCLRAPARSIVSFRTGGVSEASAAG